jgi:fatty acid desaturase/SAM-dependent methyltransferase
MLDPLKFATGLVQVSPGVWAAKECEPVSYDSCGNSLFMRIEDTSFWFQHRNRCILQAMRNMPPATPLFDVGGGNGFVSQALKTAGWDAIVVEPGVDGVKNAIARGLGPVIRSTFEAAGFHHQSLPSVGMFDVLEHIQDDVGVLRAIRKSLTPSGRLYLTVPAYRWLWSDEDRTAGHYRRYTRRQLEHTLRVAGFKVEYISYIFSFLVLPIFFMRSLPNLLGIHRSRTVADHGSDHAVTSGIFFWFVNRFMAIELFFIRKTRRLPFGGSLVVIAAPAENLATPAPGIETLAGIPDLSKLKNQSGQSYSEFTKSLRPRYLEVFSNIAFSWFMIALGTGAFYFLRSNEWYFQDYAIVPLGGLWFAFWLQSYTLHFHESAHFNLARSAKFNDLISRIFLTPFIGLDVKSYRASHWKHHRFLGAINDTEVSYHQPLTLLRLADSMTGIYLLRTVLRYMKTYRKIDQQKTGAGVGSINVFRFVFAIVYTLCMQVTIITIFWFQVSRPGAVAWATGFFLFCPFLANLRQTLEHRSLSAPTNADFRKVAHGPQNRLFGTDLFSRNFGGAGFNRHLLHHWDPRVSYTCFDEMENFLLETNISDELHRERTTYKSAFKRMFRWK